jgi:butyrate kinase
MAELLGRKYEEINVIVAHMGGEMSIAARLRGRVADVNNGLDGDGPMASERAGILPADDLARLCFAGGDSLDELLRRINGRGGHRGQSRRR